MSLKYFSATRSGILVCYVAPKNQGPIVQSIISLTSSFRGQLFKYFTNLLLNTLIFFDEKVREAFNKKYWHIIDINI